MDYDDPTQDLHIHIKKGEQVLDGDTAEQVVRFRHNNNGTTYPEEYGDNDLGRMRTQREFIMQVVKQTAKPENIFKIGQILDVAKEYVITNIDFNVAKDYVPYVVEFDTQNLLTDMLPGTAPDWNKTNGVSIFIYDKAKTKELVEKLFFDRDLEETQEEQEGNTTAEATTTVSKSEITIEVLNGSGNSNNLQKIVNQLKGAGYQVTRTGSTNTTAKTTIINKKNVKESLLKNIKDVIGTGMIQNSESSSSKVDMTIIIGTDY